MIIELYRIVLGSQVWTLTSHDATVEVETDPLVGPERYVATPIQRGEFQHKNELSKADLSVAIPIDHEIAILLLTTSAEQIMSLTVFEFTTDPATVLWKGRLASIAPTDERAALVFESVFTSMRRPGLRAKYQRSCRHALYGRGCKLDPLDFEDSGTVTAITANVVTVTGGPARGPGFYIGGMMRDPEGLLSYIISHAGTRIGLQRVSSSIVSQFLLGPVPVKLYPGCDHSRKTCNAKFANSINYGGFDWIPNKNPLAGRSIV